ncbi:glycosyltransferase family 2 protein [Glaesserella parasuis]|uniref:glycosyltransferase family 2 protein n=1 Tax=Glaesserella parasuis TaxID=738 RepID=UPI00276132B5|nr:glycosyltransferase family 2 protein [Glaesserella parasuis]
MYKISIVVPIYNSQKYIEKCLESLFQQDFLSIEYIFVNDCSTDKSLDIIESTLKKYPNRSKDSIIITNECNLGSGASRKKGIMNASGEYILQIDSDDWIELNTCSSLYDVAKLSNADIVSSDYYENFYDKEVYIQQDYTNDPEDFKKILTGKVHSSFCNKLIKRTLYSENNIYPPENYSLYEDKITILQLFYRSSKKEYIPKAFLHYRKHHGSMTSYSFNEKYVNDTILFLSELSDFFKKENLKDTYLEELNASILYHKKIFMMKEKYYNLFENLYPEVNKLKYVFGIDTFDCKRKIIMIMSMIFSRRIMGLSYKIYKKL